jgi:hypothetical protein
VPGPRRGTTTTANVGPSVPVSSPFMAFAFGTDATGFTVDLVTLEKLLSIGWVDSVVGTVTATGVVTVVVTLVVVGIERASAVVVVSRGCAVVVVVGDVLDVVAEVRVNTSTSSSTGLDHINR